MPDRESTRPKPFVFVLIPFDKKFEDIYKFGIKGAANEVDAYCERLDDQIFTEGMLDHIFNQISKADVIVADMTGRNPNVFYEVGYAHALGKIVLLLTQNSDDIPFDLKHRQHTVYSGRIETLKSELVTKLQWAILKSRNRQETEYSELFSMYIGDYSIPRTGTTEEIPVIDGIVKDTSFSLPIRVRNDSLEITSAVSHVYLFCEPDVALVPYEYVTSPLGSSNISAGAVWSFPAEPSIPSPLQSFRATPIDAKDNLTDQFRLLTTIPSLPPGAVETLNIPLMFLKTIQELNSLYRIRLHSATSYHDFSFRLKIKCEPEITKDEPSK